MSAPLGAGGSVESAEREPSRARTRVLVVEDNRDLLENLGEILEGRGHEVTKASSARLGLARVAEVRPDVMLLDLNLGDGRGLDVLAALPRISPLTAAVILTGNASLESAIEAVNRGAYAYLVKGGRIEDVVATIDRAAEKTRLEADARRLEGELRHERNFSRAVVSNAARGIIVVGSNGALLEINRKMRELLGLGPGSAADAGVRYPDRDALAAVGRDQSARERFRDALSGRGPALEQVEIEVRLANGASAIWTVSTSSVWSDDGGRDAIVAVVTDVTVERELQRRIVESTRLAAIGEMAARVAHEIRNPLAGIAGALRVLARADEAPEKREAFTKELLSVIGRLNAFVEDLLVLARPLKVTREDTSLERLMRPTLAVIRENPAARGVAIEVEDRLGRPLRVDQHHMGLVIQNLLLNAAQAMRGKGRVRIETAVGPSGREAVLAVADDGPGIRDDILPRLFEAFATTRPEGTGLGLSTVKRIVEAHGGTIRGFNRPEGGACFEMHLPL